MLHGIRNNLNRIFGGEKSKISQSVMDVRNVTKSVNQYRSYSGFDRAWRHSQTRRHVIKLFTLFMTIISTFIVYIANNIDPDQTAQFVSTVKRFSRVHFEYMQQT